MPTAPVASAPPTLARAYVGDGLGVRIAPDLGDHHRERDQVGGDHASHGHEWLADEDPADHASAGERDQSEFGCAHATLAVADGQQEDGAGEDRLGPGHHRAPRGAVGELGHAGDDCQQAPDQPRASVRASCSRPPCHAHTGSCPRCRPGHRARRGRAPRSSRDARRPAYRASRPAASNSCICQPPSCSAPGRAMTSRGYAGVRGSSSVSLRNRIRILMVRERAPRYT